MMSEETNGFESVRFRFYHAKDDHDEETRCPIVNPRKGLKVFGRGFDDDLDLETEDFFGTTKSPKPIYCPPLSHDFHETLDFIG